LLPRGSPMSPSVAPSADKLGNNSVVVGTAIDGRGKCILQSVPSAAQRPRYLLSPEKGDQCTAVIATPRSGAESVFRKVNTNRGGG